MVLLPVLVTVEPARTPKLCVVPNGGAVATASAGLVCTNKRSVVNPTLATSFNPLRSILNLHLATPSDTQKCEDSALIAFGKQCQQNLHHTIVQI